MMVHSLTDDDKDRLTNKVEELARFEEGDRVTMRPPEHDTPFFGREYVGVPLVVDKSFWNANGLSLGERARATTPECRPDDHDDRFVSLDSDEEAYISQIEYRFVQDRNQFVQMLSESGLIPWEEYREENDRTYLLTESDDESKWLEPGETCDICGCETEKHWYYDNGVVQAGGHSCAACGDVKEENAP